MSFDIPQSVFDLYNEAADAMIDTNFGVICQMVSIDMVETIVSNPDTNNIPELNSINAHRKRGRDYDRGEVTVTETEVLTEVKMRCYYDRRDWVKIAGSNVVAPDGELQTIGYMTDLPIIKRSKAMISHKGIKDYQEQRYTRVGDPIPWGFKKNRYVVCYWKRA
jgi:hypothetical protein